MNTKSELALTDSADFESRAREAAHRQLLNASNALYADAGALVQGFMTGAEWARAEMQAQSETSDAVKILHRRYIVIDEKRELELEIERLKAELEQAKGEK